MFITRFQPTTGIKVSCQTKKLIDAMTKCAFSTGALALVGFTSCPTLVQAQNYKHLTPAVSPTIRHTSFNSNLLAQFIPPPLPSDQEAPSGRRQGGASRCLECKNNDLRLTALVPGNHSRSSLALTTAEYPHFWFYIPYKLTPSDSVEFVVQDATDHYVYKTTFTAPETPSGVISLSLPPGVAPLEIGKRYHWTFLVKDVSNSVFVQGSVQRVTLNPTLIRQLKAATPSDRVALYAANGIWHETLTTLAELRCMKPQDAALTATWVDLLRSVGLNNIAIEPIVQCFTPKTTTATK